jgi:hypothetical protein
MEIRDKELKDIVEFVKGTPRANQVYGSVVKDLFRQQYKEDRVEAINNNYLDDMDNPKYIQERDEMKAYRKECKKQAKIILEIE